MENDRKMFVGMAEDMRVILMKVGDGVENMGRVKDVGEEKEGRMWNERVEIFGGLGDGVGI